MCQGRTSDAERPFSADSCFSHAATVLGSTGFIAPADSKEIDVVHEVSGATAITESAEETEAPITTRLCFD